MPKRQGLCRPRPKQVLVFLRQLLGAASQSDQTAVPQDCASKIKEGDTRMEQQQQDEQTGTLHLLELTPLFASHATPWVIKLEKELLILHADDGRIVMMLPQQDAARHLRFNRTLSGSYILSCVVVEGKAYRFNCSRANAHYLSQWLPQKPVETLREEVRRYGIAFILLGAALLLFPRLFFWGWGLTFILLGVLNVLLPYQKIHLLNALCMLSIAPIPLYFKPALGVAPGAPYDWILVASTGLGSLLIMWSIQQCALLGINHRIHAAHSCRLPATEEILPPSKAVRYILYTTLIFLLLLIGHLVGLFLQQYYTTPPARSSRLGSLHQLGNGHLRHHHRPAIPFLQILSGSPNRRQLPHCTQRTLSDGPFPYHLGKRPTLPLRTDLEWTIRGR